MRRLISLVAVLVVSSATFIAGQAGPAPQGLPGLPARPQLPGLPPRDNAAPAVAKDGTSKISGRVLGSPTGTPLRRAQIQLMSSDLTQRRMTTTDGDGRYHFDKLPAGRFSLTATKGGYVSLQYGQRRPYEAGTPVTVTDGQTLEKVDFALPRGSVIAVRVTDEFGESLTGVTVQVQRYQYGQDGRRKLTPVIGAPTPFSGTDDRGEFRLFGLMPGEYVVQAAMRTLGPGIATNDTSEGYSPTFYPGVLSADQAQPISVGLGEEQSIQFAMMSGRMGRAAGKVLDLESRPVAGASISLVTITGNGSSSGPAGQTAADGTFTVNGISPGDHTLQVTLRTPGATPLGGSVPITLSGEDLEGLTVTLGSGATLSGRVVFDGTAPRTGSPASLRVSAGNPGEMFAFMTRGAYDPLANGEVDEKGTFKLSGVSGRLFISVNAPQAWSIRSVTAGGEDVTDEPIELTNGMSIADVRIVLTDKLTQVSGLVTDDRGRPQSDYVVVVLPAQKKEPLVTSRLIRVIRPDTQGKYELRGLRAGRYVAAAVDLLEDGRQYSPEFQEKLRLRARTFSLDEGQSVTVDLELATGL